MTTTEDRMLPWRFENTLAAGFFLVILIGLLGYFQTVRSMQASTRRCQESESRVDQCISLAKDVTLYSHDTKFWTQSYLYSGNISDRDQKWEAQESADDAFAGLQAALRSLPGSAELQAQCAAAERQSRKVCEPEEEKEIALADAGKKAQAQFLLQTEGTASRDKLELQLQNLIGVNITQDPDAAPRGLTAYRLHAQAAENRVARRTLLIGEAAQGAILLLSLVIAVAFTRAASTGVRTVLHVQDTLRESEARYRILFEGNPHPLWVFDQVSREFLAVNDAALQSYGYTREEFLSLRYGALRADGEPPALRLPENALLHETTDAGERRHRRKDGSVFWVSVILHPLAWDGRATCMAIVQDVTDKREAEAGLNRLAAIVSSSHDAIVGWDRNKTVTSWNPGAEKLYGWTEAEMLGRSVAALMPEGRRDESEKICGHLEAGLPIDLPDTVRRHKSGRLLEVWVSSSPVKNAAGEIIGASTISRSIAEQKRTQALIRWQAHNDPLTRLPNRAFFQQALEDAIALGAPFSLVFVDLDQFKHVNDSLGHAAGDYLLQEVAARFERCLADGDILARMGGDEFTLLLPGGGAEDKADALLRALAPPLLIEGQELHTGASLGLSRFPEDGRDAETLLQCADLAMYQAKERGRGQWQLFSPALTEAARERLTLESSLRKAWERDEMILLYQPQVSLATGEVIGAEALVRWQHRELGLISPVRFIPLAEETGLIVPLGEWVLQTACRQAAAWKREGISLRLSVNLSARQLGEKDLVERVRAVLEKTGLEPRLLDLELTESALVAQGEAAVARLAALRALGVRISIDDFGTGYSSLAYLRRFPLDTLKIDRSFVSDLSGMGRHARQDQAVVRAIISMAHALDLEVVAEGVETAAQRETLRRLGCDSMQGFLFSPPVTAERLQSLLPAKRREVQAA